MDFTKALIKKFQLYIGISLSLVVLYFILKFSASYLIASSIKNLFEDDFKNEIRLENISFEPSRLVLKVQDLKLNDGASLSRIYVNFSFPNLITKKLHISEIEIDGLKGNILKKENRFLFSGLKNKDETKDKNKSKWRVIIDKAVISNSVIALNQDHKIEIKNLEINNFDSDKGLNSIGLKALALVNGSHFSFDGKISNEKSLINFSINNFDLKIVNIFLNDSNFGKITGKLSSQGVFELEDETSKLTLNLKLQNAFLYSKNLELVNYFIEKLEAKKIQIKNSDTTLNLKSDGLKLRNLLLSVPSEKLNQDKLSKFSEIEIENINFFSKKNSVDKKALVNFSHTGFLAFNQYAAGNKVILDVKANAVDLTQFSSSFEPLLNYQIESGKLSLDAKTFRIDEKIAGEVKINLSQIGLDDENEFGQDIENQSSIPFATALSMIEDDDGNVELSFDIYGNKSDPDFNMLGMMGRGIGSFAISKLSSVIAEKLAIKFTPMLVSAIPLSPSNVFTFVNGAYKVITKPRFKDIEFESLNSDIKQSSKANLAEIIGFLKENKKIKLLFCPIASAQEFDDKETSDDKVLSLANDRVKSLKKYFKTHDDGVLDQTIFCRPKISNDNDVGKAIVGI